MNRAVEASKFARSYSSPTPTFSQYIYKKPGIIFESSQILHRYHSDLESDEVMVQNTSSHWTDELEDMAPSSSIHY